MPGSVMFLPSDLAQARGDGGDYHRFAEELARDELSEFDKILAAADPVTAAYVGARLGPERIVEYRKQKPKEKGKAMLMRVAFTKRPSVLEQQAGAVEELIVDYTTVTADSVQDAVARAVFQNYEKLKESKVPINKITSIVQQN